MSSSHTHHHYVGGAMVIMHADGSAITPAECVECRFPGASTEPKTCEGCGEPVSGNDSMCDPCWQGPDLSPPCDCGYGCPSNGGCRGGNEPQPEPERCNATWDQNGKVIRRCCLTEPHSMHRSWRVGDESDVHWWEDTTPGAKPHEPAREEHRGASYRCGKCGENYISTDLHDCSGDDRALKINRLIKERDHWKSSYDADTAMLISQRNTHERNALALGEQVERLTKERDTAQKIADGAIADAMSIGKECDEAQDLAIKRGEIRVRLKDELQAFRDAKDRPWFCRSCNGHGRLKPFGRYGFKCEQCSCEYIQDGVTVDSVERREIQALRSQLATLKAEMLRLVGGA